MSSDVVVVVAFVVVVVVVVFVIVVVVVVVVEAFMSRDISSPTRPTSLSAPTTATVSTPA